MPDETEKQKADRERHEQHNREHREKSEREAAELRRKQRIDDLARKALEAGRVSKFEDARALVTQEEAARQGGTVPSMFKRFLGERKTLEEQIAEGHRKIAEKQAEILRIQSDHKLVLEKIEGAHRAVTSAREVRTGIAERLAELKDKFPHQFAYLHTRVSRDTVVSLVQSIDSHEGALATVDAFIAKAEKDLSAFVAERTAFEKKHADDLAPVEA